ncbi:uncharacterized protein LOC129095293 [Anoplopoma fimbria]|uniref:uncharacterized protein LOC129095293 n=1 Tax=Anoplopoma fimbria TaxID=229290 RepID=UPI0023EC7C2A|nr:uncharacterized protein LOC129095293 [Anoplopoma fimbria]
MGGMTRLLLLLWAGVTVGTVVDLQKRIIGGHDCEKTERVYHVQVGKLLSNGKFDFQCGGSLIGAQWILTAAHCWNDTWIMRAHLGVHPGPGQGTIVEVTPHFFMDNQIRKHDIMLLEITKRNIHHTTFIQLSDCGSPLTVGDEVQIAGHASTTMGPNNIRDHDTSLTLQCANTEVVDCTELRTCLENNYILFWASRSYEHWLCCQKDKVDASPGDSGGGVVFKGKLYGVHSFTGNPTHACVEAAGFMDVCKEEYMDWILDTTGIPRPQTLWDKVKGCVGARLGVRPGRLVEFKPNFFMDNKGRRHDIMLLELTKPNTDHKKYEVVSKCEYLSFPFEKGDEVQIAGHASTTKGPNNIRVPGETVKLQCANTEVVNCQKLRNCQSVYWQSVEHEHWLCYQRAGVDTSPGDSGGGVVFNGMLYGVHVFTSNPTHACVEAAGFMDVCKEEYMDWIVKTTGIPRPKTFWGKVKGCVSCG